MKMQKKSMGPGFAVLLMLAACSSPSETLDSAPNDAGADLASSDAAGMRTTLRVDFNDGTFGPLGRSYGPTDNPMMADSRYTVNVVAGEAHYVAPAAAGGARLTGMLDLPSSVVPIRTNLTHEFRFPVAAELRALGNGQAAATAIAGCYLRGGLIGAAGEWQGGLYGDYWFGFVLSNNQRVSAIRQGNTNLQSEPFPTTATSVSYRIEKSGTTLQLFASYDGAGFHQVGNPVTLLVNAGGTDAVAVTHVRVLDTSGAAIDVRADDFVWTY